MYFGGLLGNGFLPINSNTAKDSTINVIANILHTTKPFGLK